MSFWHSRTGVKIDGSDENCFANYFPQIPDNTVASAVIKHFTMQTFESEDYYQVIWELIDGDYAGSQVRQRISPFDADDNKAQRSLNMLMRLFVLCKIKPSHDGAPSNDELSAFKGIILCIKTGAGVYNSKPFTNVREVHEQGKLATKTGVVTTIIDKPTSSVETAFSRNEAKTSDLRNSDVPF